MNTARIFLLLFLSLLFIGQAAADELTDAYQKEFAFLKAQKDELADRLTKEQKQQTAELSAARNAVNKLEEQYVDLTKSQNALEKEIEKAEEQLGDKTSNAEIITSVITQMKDGLEDYGITVDDTAGSQMETLEKAFGDALSLYDEKSSVKVKSGSFYLTDGTTVSGEIVQIGGIAAYGISTKANGALAPAGNGEFKIWPVAGSDVDALAIYENQRPKTSNIFLFENLDSDVEYQAERTYRETIESGGVIGSVILGLGVFGILLLIARFTFLLRAGSNVKQITRIVSEKLETGNGDDAYGAVRNFKGSIARVIRATLRNIKRDREHIEDIITESILNENRTLDKFGNFILVIAGVAPLLGLLGTVTGMINTFDVITVNGTGDPKLLSGGISEALVTTMLGLIIAIPLLLLGNISKGWADNIKDAMEHSALHIVNLFEKHNAGSESHEVSN